MNELALSIFNVTNKAPSFFFFFSLSYCKSPVFPTAFLSCLQSHRIKSESFLASLSWCLFPRVSITKCHWRAYYNNNRNVILLFQDLEVLNQGVSRAILYLSGWNLLGCFIASGSSWKFSASLGLRLHPSNLCFSPSFSVAWDWLRMGLSPQRLWPSPTSVLLVGLGSVPLIMVLSLRFQ